MFLQAKVTRILTTIAVIQLYLVMNPAWATDACSGRSIRTAASVVVSDGSRFDTESFFHSAEFSAIKHIRDDIQIVSVEGPLAWASRGENFEPGSERLKNFALGHQFHGLLLHFDEIVAGVRRKNDLAFQDQVYTSEGGSLPYGGTIYLVHGDDEQHPLGFLFEVPDNPPMEITFGDWREQDGLSVPFQISIDDGARVFNYSYRRIDITESAPGWFFSAVDAPAYDELRVYRLHRKLLAAHCTGDAALMARLTAPDIVVSGRGELHRSSSQALEERFTSVFQRLDYTVYQDLVSPIIEVSESDDMGWIAVNTHSVGREIESGRPFDMQWSWIMLVRKLDGVWLNAGNASNHLPPPERPD